MTALDFPASPTDGQTFGNYIYNATRGVWSVQANVPGISSRYQVSATAPTTPQNGDTWFNSTDGITYMYYVDGDTSQWIEVGGVNGQAPELNGLSDVTITSPADNELISYDNSSGNWINQTPSEAGIAEASHTHTKSEITDFSHTHTASEITDISTYIADNAAPKLLTETSEQTLDYTLSAGDVNKVVLMNGSNLTVTVPTNASVAFSVGTVINVYNINSTDLTIAGDSGVTVRNAGDLAQYGEVSLRKRGTDEWVLAGNVS
jgi:hypothetical protein